MCAGELPDGRPGQLRLQTAGRKQSKPTPQSPMVAHLPWPCALFALPQPHRPPPLTKSCSLAAETPLPRPPLRSLPPGPHRHLETPPPREALRAPLQRPPGHPESAPPAAPHRNPPLEVAHQAFL